MRPLDNRAFTIAGMSTSATAILSDLHVVLPIRSHDAAKTRLGLALDPEERDVLVIGMLANTVRVLAGWPPCQRMHVVTSDYALTGAIGRGVDSMVTVSDPGSGLNDALRAG